MIFTQTTALNVGRRVGAFASIGIALLLILAACAGPSRPEAVSVKSTPVRVSLRSLAEVVGTYRNGAGFLGYLAGSKPADMRIFPDGSANWTSFWWMSYADYTDKGMVASPPYLQDTRSVGKLLVRDGMLCSQEGNGEPLFVAYLVDASALEQRDGGYESGRLSSPPLPPAPSANKKRPAPVLILIPFGNRREFESKGAAFHDYDFNLFERWSSGLPANSVPIPNPQPELVVAGNTDEGVLLEADDADGDEVSFTLVDLPTHGRLSLQSKDPHRPIYFYHSAPGYLGPDRFSFEASDGRGTSAPREIKIQVMEPPRVIVPEGLTTTEGTPLAITLVAVPFGNLPGRKAKLEFQWFSTRHSGSIQRTSNDDTFTYVPRRGFVGTDTFSCWAIDDRRKSEEVKVTIVVTAATKVDVHEGNSQK